MIDDERARVPFAIVGVVLLLASATLVASSLSDRPAAAPDVNIAMDRASAETRTAIRRAVSTAADAAARNPVVVRGDTPAGDVLDPTTPFRDSLRVRIYLQARERLADLSVRQGDVRVSASLPPTPNTTALKRAVRRVDIRRAGENGTALEVTVANVTVTARRGGRTIARRRMNRTVVVRTPVLELHEAVETYERRLNRNVTKPGLAQGLTARLLQVAWIRGYAQYASQGLIGNVIDSGHVELTTNQAILYEQRHVFGQSDAAGRRALRRATARVALSDLFTPWGRYPKKWVDLVLRGGPIGRNDTTTIPRFERRTAIPGPNSRKEVNVGTVADEAFGATIASDNLSAVLRSTYSARVRLTNETRSVGGHWPSPPDRPEADGAWTAGQEYTRWKEVTVVDTVTPRAADPAADWHTLRAYAFRVRATVQRVQQWESGNRTTRTKSSATLTYRVDLWLQGKHAPVPTAPRRGIATVHRRGAGPFDGPNLAGVERNATRELVANNGGARAIARKIIELEPGAATDARQATVVGARPDGLRAAVVENLTAFRERVRNVSTMVQRDRLATMQANPAGDLVMTIDDRRGELIDAPATYGSVAEKATIAVQGAYLAHVVRALNRQRWRHRDASGELGTAFEKANAGSKQLLRRAMTNRRQKRDAELTGRTDDGTKITTVNGSPPYLTVGQVGHAQVPALPTGRTVYPLAARNVNLFTIPYADFADALFDALLGSPKTVSLGHAATVLQASQRLRGNATVNKDRARLHRTVERTVDSIEIDLRRALEDVSVGSGTRDRQRTVTAGLARWQTSAQEARSLANRSALDPLVRAAARRHGLNETRTAVVRARLAHTLRESLDEHQIRQAKVNPLAPPTRQAAKYAAGEAISSVLEASGRNVLDRLDGKLRQQINDDIARKLGGKTTNRVPAGLPLLPIGTWYTTVNAWYVEVRGAYPRFAIGARRGGPDETDGTLTYVRERAPVRIDFDGDGTAERFGHNERVAFAIETSVAVAVPPGPPGVGDTDGNMDERSVGWSEWTNGQNASAPDGWPPATD